MRLHGRFPVGLAMALVLLGGAGAARPGRAEAGGPTPGPRAQLNGKGHHHPRPYVNPFYPPPNQNVHAAPYSVIPPRPVPVAPASIHWVPGHWVERWVPTFASVPVWGPAHHTRDGHLVPGRWEHQVVETGGHYESVWVNGHWRR